MQISSTLQRKLKVGLGMAGALLATAPSAFAAATINLPAPGAGTGFFPDAQTLINDLLRIIMIIGVLLVFAYLILGGIEYITSGGEKGKTEAARNKITSAVIGLIILAASYAILTIALTFIGTSTSQIFTF